MASHREAARHIARALADTLGDDDLDPVARDLRVLGAAVEADATFRSALANPALSAEKRAGIARRVSEHLSASDKTLRFLGVLAEAEALPLLPQIADAFAEARDERRGIVKASVTSARPLDDEQRARLRGALSRLTGHDVKLEESTDPSLIGGVVTRIGSTLYDGSLRNRLAGLRGRVGS